MEGTRTKTGREEGPGKYMLNVLGTEKNVENLKKKGRMIAKGPEIKGVF